MKIIYFQAVDTITFCGCLGTHLQQRGDDTWVVKGDDVKAVVKGVSAEYSPSTTTWL